MSLLSPTAVVPTACPDAHSSNKRKSDAIDAIVGERQPPQYNGQEALIVALKRFFDAPRFYTTPPHPRISASAFVPVSIIRGDLVRHAMALKLDVDYLSALSDQELAAALCKACDGRRIGKHVLDAPTMYATQASSIMLAMGAIVLKGIDYLAYCHPLVDPSAYADMRFQPVIVTRVYDLCETALYYVPEDVMTLHQKADLLAARGQVLSEIRLALDLRQRRMAKRTCAASSTATTSVPVVDDSKLALCTSPAASTGGDDNDQDTSDYESDEDSYCERAPDRVADRPHRGRRWLARVERMVNSADASLFARYRVPVDVTPPVAWCAPPIIIHADI